jgi:phosphate/sulfate permease
MATVFSGLLGAIVWNLITWWLCGAAVATARRQLGRAAMARWALAKGDCADAHLARDRVRRGVVERILWAWVFTLPATGLIEYICARLARAL